MCAPCPSQSQRRQPFTFYVNHQRQVTSPEAHVKRVKCEHLGYTSRGRLMNELLNSGNYENCLLTLIKVIQAMA